MSASYFNASDWIIIAEFDVADEQVPDDEEGVILDKTEKHD